MPRYFDRAFRLLAFLFLLVVPLGQGAKAASILFDAASIESQVVVEYSGFVGVSINGSTFDTTAGSQVFGDGTSVNVQALLGFPDVDVPSRTIYWVDPSAPTMVTEILISSLVVESPITRFFATFQAGGALGEVPLGTDPADVIVKQPDGSHDPLSFSVGSVAVEVLVGPSATLIPLPAALPLMAVGLGGLALVGARRRRA